MTAATEPWQFPLEEIVGRHRNRIDPDVPVQPFTVECWFNGVDVPPLAVWIPCGTPDIEQRDAMLHAADVLGTACEPDYLVMVYDTHLAKSMVNPATGKTWGPHEMQNLCDNEGFCDTGQIRDNLVVNVVRRTDHLIHMHSIPYHVVDGKVHYFDEEVGSEWPERNDATKTRYMGMIPNALREALRGPSLTSMLEALLGPDVKAAELTPAELRMHRIMAAARILTITATNSNAPDLFVPVIAAETPEERDILQQSAARSGLGLQDLKATP